MISEFPLFLFTTLAGLAAGAYAVSAVFPVGKDPKKAWLFPLVCGILLAVGLVGLPLHLGAHAARRHDCSGGVLVHGVRRHPDR